MFSSALAAVPCIRELCKGQSSVCKTYGKEVFELLYNAIYTQYISVLNCRLTNILSNSELEYKIWFVSPHYSVCSMTVSDPSLLCCSLMWLGQVRKDQLSAAHTLCSRFYDHRFVNDLPCFLFVYGDEVMIFYLSQSNEFACYFWMYIT